LVKKKRETELTEPVALIKLADPFGLHCLVRHSMGNPVDRLQPQAITP
jgi:hypothetical protein